MNDAGRLYHSPDLLTLRFWLAPLPFADHLETIQPLLATLESSSLAPDEVFFAQGPVPWSRGAVAESIRTYKQLWFGRSRAPRVELVLGKRGDGGIGSHFHGHIEREGLGEPEVEALIAFARAFAQLGALQHGIVHPRRDLAVMDLPALEREARPPTLHEPCWLTVLGGDEVERLGRAKVLATPAHRVEPAGDAVVIMTAPIAALVGEAARRAQAETTAHFSPAVDVDQLIRGFEVRDTWMRSAELPAQLHDPHDPDYLPPVPVEILHVTGAWPSEGEAMDTAELAERAVAFTHHKVGSASRGYDEATVALLDRFLIEFPKQWVDADPYDLLTAVAPAFGGMLGEAMVRHLGGTWIPRRAVREYGVRVGAYVFLPMLRAALALRAGYGRSVQGHSLSHLFALAKRAAAGEPIPCAGSAATCAAFALFERPSFQGRELGGRRITAASFDAVGTLWTGEGDDVVGWEIPSGRPVALQGWNWIVAAVAKLGDELLTLDACGTLRIWDLPTGARLEKVGVGQSQPRSLVVNGDLICWSQSKQVCAYRRHERVRVLEGHSSPVVAVAITDDEIVSVATERKVRRWSRRDFIPLAPVPTGKPSATGIAARGSIVALALRDGQVELFPSGLTGPRIAVGEFAGASISFDQAGRLVVRSGNDVTVLDGQDGTMITRCRIEAEVDRRDVVVISPGLEWGFVRPYQGTPQLVPIRVIESSGPGDR